jgi:hypothetical protein
MFGAILKFSWITPNGSNARFVGPTLVDRADHDKRPAARLDLVRAGHEVSTLMMDLRLKIVKVMTRSN